MYLKNVLLKYKKKLFRPFMYHLFCSLECKSNVEESPWAVLSVQNSLLFRSYTLQIPFTLHGWTEW